MKSQLLRSLLTNTDVIEGNQELYDQDILKIIISSAQGFYEKSWKHKNSYDNGNLNGKKKDYREKRNNITFRRKLIFILKHILKNLEKTDITEDFQFSNNG